MKIKLKRIGLAVALLTSLNVSIPAAISGPAPDPAAATSVPLSPFYRKHNGAQVRVTFDLAPALAPDKQFSCDETYVEVRIVEEMPSQPNQLIKSYRTLGTYKGTTTSASMTSPNACLYNFNLSRNFVGKQAFVSVSSTVLPLRTHKFIGGTGAFSPLPIKSPLQTFNVKATIFVPPN
jgi:hypothetical protein